MKKLVSTALSLLTLSCALVSAQTFNPRVEVENTYEGKIIEAGKQALPMTVPDSLYKFQYKLDYTIFDNPYRGSYQFQPYKIEMKPDAVPSAARKLFVNLGAGWSLHPEVDLVWSPAFRSQPLKMSIYDRFRGFWGNYGLMNYASDFQIPARPTSPSKGYVLDNKVGANVRYEFSKVAFEFDGGYHLFTSSDTLSSHFLQLAEAEIRLMPLDPNKADYFYGGRLYVNAGPDRYSSLMSDRHTLGVNEMGADIRFGVPVTAGSRVLVDLGIESTVYSGVLEAVATRMWVTPRYTLAWNSGFAELGVKLSYLMGSDNTANKDVVVELTPSAFQHRSDYIYPAVMLKQFLIPGHLAVYAKATGGDELNNYADALFSNPFTDPMSVVPNLDSSSERVNASLGVEGNLLGQLQYDLHGGYAVRHNWRCESVEFVDRIYTEPMMGWSRPFLSSYYSYNDYNMWYADLSFLWKSARLDLDGHFRFQDTDLSTREGFDAVAPSRFLGSVQATYNWNRQAFAGISLSGASRRTGTAIIAFYPDWPRTASTSVAGWVDLGLFGRYVINPHWTVWAKAGNLLGQPVQHYFLHPERGPYGTLGITFNL